jgi:PEP-CTERM motif
MKTELHLNVLGKRWRGLNTASRFASVLALLWGTVGIASANTIDLGTFSVDPHASYLLASSSDSPLGALFINLSTLSTPIGAGDVLILTTVGDYCNMGGTPCTETAQALGGVFSSSNTLLATSNLNRIPGAIMTAGVADSPDPNAWYGNLSTAIPQDFQIFTGSGLNVTVPTGAQWLAVGVLDSYYGDNSDPNHNLGINIALVSKNLNVEAVVPEPATYALFLSGITGIFLLRRFKLLKN